MKDGPAPERRQPLPRVDYSAVQLPVWLALPLQEPRRGRLLDISRDGIGVALEGVSPFDLAAAAQVSVTLGDQLLQSRPARIAHLTTQAAHGGRDTLQLGLQLLIDSEQPLSELTFSRTDPDWDLIGEKEALQELFSDLLAYGAGSEMRLHAGREMVRGTLLERAAAAEPKDIRLGLSLPPNGLPWQKGPALVATFDRYGCTYLFHADLKEQSGSEISLAWPKAVIRLLRRRTSRLEGDKIANFSLEIIHPLRRERISRLPLIEINEQGCLIRLPQSFALYPMYLSRIPLKLSWGATPGSDTATVAELLASLCSLRLNPDGSYLAGLAFSFPNEDGRRLLTAELIRRRRPMIDILYRAADHQKIWRLFEESHYLELKSKESFAPVFKKAGVAWSLQQQGMDIISRKIMIRQADQIMGHLQIDRAYPNAWIVHQLAIHPNMTKLLAGQIYTSLTDFLTGREIPFVISSVDSNKPWNSRNYFDFIKTYPYPEHHDLTHNDLFEFNFNSRPSSQSQDLSLQVGNCTEFDIKTIARFFELSYSPLRRQALGLENENFFLEKTDQLYAQFGLFRKRDFIVLKRSKKLCAFAMLESASDGINVCNLLDVFRIFIISGKLGPTELSWARDLALAAIEYYRKLGKSGLLFFSNQIPKEFWEKLGFKFVYLESNWICQGSVYSRFAAYTSTMYGRLLARKERIKSRF